MSEENDLYVYLDLNEKLTTQIFDKKLFLRIANLHKANPLVQINDLVFKGTYDDCIGTNLFFEEIEDPPIKTNIYEKDAPINLRTLVKQTKIIKLKQIKLPHKVTPLVSQDETVSLNLNQEYSVILEKLEHGTLNVEDIVLKETAKTDCEIVNEATFDEIVEDIAEPETTVETQLNLLNNRTKGSVLEAKYERLKRLARRPVRRSKSPEVPSGSDTKYQSNYEYRNLEAMVLRNSDAFRSSFVPILGRDLIGGVDLDRCILQGLIEPSSNIEDRILNDHEIDTLLTVQNFDNLSLPLRYLILKESLKKMEEKMTKASKTELEEINEVGKSSKDICNIFRKLIAALEAKMALTSEFKDSNDFIIKKVKEKNYFKLKKNDCEDLVGDLPEICTETEFVNVHECGE